MPALASTWGRRALHVAVALALCAGAAGATAAGAAPAPPSQSIMSASSSGGVFVAVDPVRVLDTRIGIGGAPLAPLGSYDLQIAGVAGVPGDALSVVLNVTATEATEVSYVTLQPSGQPPQLVSSLNFGPGQTVANLVAVKIGSNGKVWVHNAAGTAHVIADLAGYFVPGGSTSGPQGPAGPAGAAGPIGADGADGADAQFTASTKEVTLKTSPMGPPFIQGMLPPSGFLDAAPTFTELSGAFDTFSGLTSQGVPQVVANDFTLSEISASATLTGTQTLLGTTVTLAATIWAVPQGSTTGQPIPGAVCTLSPMSGIVARGTTVTCHVTGLSVPITAGTRLFSAVSATAAGMLLLVTIPVAVTVSFS